VELSADNANNRSSQKDSSKELKHKENQTVHYIGKDLGAKLKFKALKDQFRWVEDEILESVYNFNDCNVSKSIKALSELYPSLILVSNKRPKHLQESKLPEIGVLSSKETKSVYDVMDEKEALKEEKAKKNPNEFTVVTKKKVKEKKAHKDEHYQEEAQLHANLRLQYFRQAALAYMSGNGALANELSSKGRYHGNMVKDLHKQLYSKLFTNSVQRVDSVMTVDFHGLFVKEAIEVLEEVVQMGKESNGPKLLSIITGVGKHSEGRKARIKPAVTSWLRENGFKFNESNAGTIVVQLN